MVVNVLDDKIINELMKLSKIAVKKDEVPVGAVIVFNNKIIAKGYNKRNKSNLTIDHAEIIAITKASKKLKDWRLSECDLYVSLEPCEMCKSIIKEARLKNVYYLVSQNSDKVQHNKTEFIKLDNKKSNIYNKIYSEYKKQLSDFFLDKR
jgi:tRNA(Arg) A34 adenosine deaminase TadA